jgi:hypothetical protein
MNITCLTPGRNPPSPFACATSRHEAPFSNLLSVVNLSLVFKVLKG